MSFPKQFRSSWITQKPSNYIAPRDPDSLVSAKITQFRAVVSSLGKHLPAGVQLDQALLSKILGEHLRKNPTSSDPYQINFRIDSKTDTLVLKHYNLKYKISATEQGKFEKVHPLFGPTKLTHGSRLVHGIPQVGKWTPVKASGGYSMNFVETNAKADEPFAQGNEHQVLIAMLHNHAVPVQDKLHIVEKLANELHVESGIAGLYRAIQSGKASDIPAPAKLLASMKALGAGNTETERHIARDTLGKLINHLIKPIELQINHGQHTDPALIMNLTDTALVLLKQLNTSSQAITTSTNTNLNVEQLQTLITFLEASPRTRHQQAVGQFNEAEQFASHLRQKIVHIQSVGPVMNIFYPLPAQALADRDVMIAVVQKNPTMLAHASEEIRSDLGVVMTAVKNNGQVWRFASDTLQNNRELAMLTVQRNPGMLRHLSEEFQNDHEVVMAAVQKNGYALQFASPALRGNREIVITAVRSNQSALQYATDEIRNDPAVKKVSIP